VCANKPVTIGETCLNEFKDENDIKLTRKISKNAAYVSEGRRPR